MLKRIERSIPSLYDRLDKIYIDVSSTLPKKKDRKGRKSKKGKDLKSSSRNVDTKSKKNKRAGKKDKGKNKNK
jgi:hypothetical protein